MSLSPAATAAAVPALQRGLEILEYIATRPQGATFSDLQSGLRIPSASLARLLQVLMARGFLARRTDATWQLGAALVRLGSVAAERNDLFSVARPILFDLMRTVNETVELSIPAGEALLLVQKIECERSIRLFIQPGSHFHSLHALASGKVFLAFGDLALRENFYRRGKFKRCTPRTIVALPKLRAEIQRVFAQGFAIDHEEGRLGVSRMAAPVFDVDHHLTAILAIAGPADRLKPSRRAPLIDAVRAAARDLSHALGAGRHVALGGAAALVLRQSDDTTPATPATARAPRDRRSLLSIPRRNSQR